MATVVGSSSRELVYEGQYGQDVELVQTRGLRAVRKGYKQRERYMRCSH